MSTTETKVRHSALPWRFDGSVTIDADGKAALSVPASADLRAANREFMLRAVNSHADMLEALEAIMKELQTVLDTWGHLMPAEVINDHLRKVIERSETVCAKAKGGAA